VAVILIVEDEYFVREIAVSTAEDLGHEVLSATDVEEAMLYLRSPQHIDALATDIRLNAASRGGYEVAEQAIRLRPNLRVLYMTGSLITEMVKDLFVEGALFLQKPYSQSQLENSLKELLAARV
jgi:CheY-like chemotaxis protein